MNTDSIVLREEEVQCLEGQDLRFYFSDRRFLSILTGQGEEASSQNDKGDLPKPEDILTGPVAEEKGKF